MKHRRSHEETGCAVAACLAVLAAGCTFGGSPDRVTGRSTTTPTTRPLVHGVVAVTRGYDVAGGAVHRVTGPAADRLVVGKRISLRVTEWRSALLVFPTDGLRPRCLRQVTLRLHVEGRSGRVGPLAAYPSALWRAAASGNAIGRTELLISNRPRGVLIVPARTGDANADVTELVKAWLGVGSFAGAADQPRPTGPLTLSVQPADLESGSFALRLAGPGSAHAPRLDWRATAGC